MTKEKKKQATNRNLNKSMVEQHSVNKNRRNKKQRNKEQKL